MVALKETHIVYLDEQILSLMARERQDEAMRHAERRRSLRRARNVRTPARVRLGTFLVRLGQRLIAEPRVRIPAR